MAFPSTTYIDYSASTPITATWLNSVNAVANNLWGSAGAAMTADTSNNVTTAANFTTSGTITTNGGAIIFPATQIPSSNVNALDDYEEGTWTPQFTFDTPGNLAVTYTTQTGTYTKIGNRVYVDFTLVISNISYTTSSGNVRITGLPFSSSGPTGHIFVGPVSFGTVSSGGQFDLCVSNPQGTAYMNLLASLTTPPYVAFLATSNYPSGTGTQFIGSFCYKV